jgi:hypothetical protein
MATFNDLNRVMEDTIRVDMKKRWTPQEVKFINNKNEYYGTFHGKIESTGATLTNVDLSNATIYNDQGEKIEINDLLKLEQRVTDAEDNITELQTNVEVLSIDVQELKSSSSGIDEKLDEETKNRDKGDKALDEKITALSNEIDSEISNRISADDEIYSTIDEEVAELNKTIEETDKAINNRIDDEVNDIYNDVEISVDNLLSTIANDKHYKIVNVSNVDKNYVLKDFAVNNIDDVVSQGSVAHDDITIGKISGIARDEKTGKITSITLTTLRDFDDKKIEHCLPPNAVSYTLNSGNEFQTQVLDGYFLSFKDNDELSDSTFNLDSHRTGGCDVTFTGVVVGAVVDDSYDKESGNLLSGRLELVPGSSSVLSAFDKKLFSFYDRNTEYTFEGPGAGLRSKISVVPALKKITLKQNFTTTEAINLRNEVGVPVEVGRIDKGDISTESMTVRITDNVAESLMGTYVLSSPEFSYDIDKDYVIKFDDSRVKICRKHNLFEYKTLTKDGNPSSTTIRPNLENRIVGDGSFDELSVFVKDAKIKSLTTDMIVLSRIEGFTKTLTSDVDVTIVSFAEDDNTVKADTTFKDGGATLNQKYKIVVEDRTEIKNDLETIVKTQQIDVESPKYDEVESEG